MLADNFILQHKGKTIKSMQYYIQYALAFINTCFCMYLKILGETLFHSKMCFDHCWTQELCCTNYKYNTERVWHYQSVFKFFWWKWKVSLSWRCVPTSKIFIIKSSLEIHPGLIGNLHNCDVEIWSMHCTKPRNLFSIM